MVGGGADAADARRDDGHLLGRHSLDQILKAAQLGGLEVGGNDLSIVNFEDNPRVTFDTT
jgi:hypothetical protein